jgi:hypothetical protein
MLSLMAIKKALPAIGSLSVLLIVCACIAKGNPEKPTTDQAVLSLTDRTDAASSMQRFVPSASDLDAFLSVFPEIIDFPRAIEDTPPIGYPSLVKSERSPDIDLASAIMNWPAPPDRWRPSGWTWDLPQEAETPAPPEPDNEAPPGEAPMLGDSDYVGEWQHGFFAVGRIVRQDFQVLIACYSEAFAFDYSDPWIREYFEYRLVTIAPNGRYIDSVVLFPSRLAETYHPGTQAYGETVDEPVDEPMGIAMIGPDLSIEKGERSSREGTADIFSEKYAIDKAGKIRLVESGVNAQDPGK